MSEGAGTPFGFDAKHAYARDAFPAGVGGIASEPDAARSAAIDPETGLSLWSATRLATLQAKLNQRLGPEYLSQRPGPGGGSKLTYIEGWKAVDLANEIFGFNGWSTSVTSLDVDYVRVTRADPQLDIHPETGKCNCGVSAIVRITLRDGTYHEDVGYGHTEGIRGKHAALEKCKKEAITDSIKRGLKTFGRLLGNCLYDRQYARDVLKMPVPSMPLQASDLHRHADVQGMKRPAPSAADDEAKKQARLRQAAAAKQAAAERASARRETTTMPTASKAAPIKAEPLVTTAKPASDLDEEALWCHDDAEAATMALELELEEDLLLRQSQLVQELEEEV